MHKVSVYKDRSVGSWWWICHVPFCGRQEWVVGDHRSCVRDARSHLDGHFRTGFGRG